MKTQGEKPASRPVLTEIFDISVSRNVVSKTVYTHFHNYYELELVVYGEGEQTVNGTKFSLKRGSLTFLSPVDFHEITPKTPKITVYNLSFPAAFITRLFTDSMLNTGVTITDLDEREVGRFETVFKFLLEEKEADDRLSQSAREALTQYMLVLFERIKQKRRVSGADRDTSPISTAIQYIFEHYLESPTFEQVATVSGYAPTYFSKIFHQITGQKYSDFIATMKINHAKMLLMTTKMTTTDIAYACGFKSSQTFYRVYKKKTGTYPKEFRQAQVK
jgi:AraC-like DNA-binding protein